MDDNQTPLVDVVVLSRSSDPLRIEVAEGLRQQAGVQIIVHRVVGEVRASDRCRWETIARARNAGKQLGLAPWLMFLDDDVVLAPDCIAALLNELKQRPIYAALGADYSSQEHPGQIAGHVSMGATLFRRSVLDQIEFRWADQRCECQCCCDDLRNMFWAIDYLPTARAEHRVTESCCDLDSAPPQISTFLESGTPPRGLPTGGPTVCLVACYFGSLPGWIEYYLKSCASNPTIDFLLFSDCEDFPNVPPNVHVVPLQRGEFNHLASRKLGFEILLSHPRKLCDFKPLYGYLFEEYLTGYDYWGYTDLDVIYGDLRRYLAAANLVAYDVFTTRREFLVGHLTLFRNTAELRHLYECSRDFQQVLIAPQVQSFDECGEEWDIRLRNHSGGTMKSCDSMTHVVDRLAREEKLRVHFATFVLEWPELGATGWVARWEAGKLHRARPWREAMYCHFHFFKHHLGYKFPPLLNGESAFELTSFGISPPSRIDSKKIEEDMLLSAVGQGLEA
jgi:hypothetical protein